MSNTQFVFINHKNIPTIEQLQEVIDKSGYNLKLDPELSLLRNDGFSPCILQGEKGAGFELFCEPAAGVVQSDEKIKKVVDGKDTCISMSWGSSFKDCLCILIVSHALMKEFGALSTYECEELDTLKSLQAGINETLEEIKKEKLSQKEFKKSQTTDTKLKKYSDEFGFTKELEKLGFQLGPNKFWFYRHRGEYLDLIVFWISSSKIYMTVPIDCQKIDIIKHCDMTNFPKGFMKNFGLNSDCFIDDEDLSYAGWDWEIETKSEVKITLSEILKLIKCHAENWFQNITTDKKMFYSYSLRMQESEFGQELKNELNIS